MGLRYLAYLTLLLSPVTGQAQVDIEEPPIEYSKTRDDNSVTDLMARLKSGETELAYDRTTGYLRSLLTALDVHESSQALVFSKTSMQVRYISPRNPRAIYFNDDVYVGWVRGSELMEISTSDAKLGAAFYTVTMTPEKAQIKRANYDCLACHATTLTQGIPGHTVRSVHPTVGGTMDPKKRSFVTDHTSPLSERWGGWYVTGRHGDMKHMGNAFLRGGQLDTTRSANRQSLRDSFQVGDWLTPYSDIVSLMVLEHQTQMHNTFTHADFIVRRAMYDNRTTSATTSQTDARNEFDVIVADAAAAIVDYLLFVDEAALTSEIRGSIVFKGQFSRRGPQDAGGRSLREFDLKTRLFRYPCSYLIYSRAFDSLQEPLRLQVYRQLWELLNSSELSPRYNHLDGQTRETILQILRETKEDLPDFWTDLGRAKNSNDQSAVN